MSKSQLQSIKITPEMAISDLVENFPEVVDFLMVEYGFHCVNCILSNYDTLQEGARIHGIVDEDFEQMLGDINKIVNGEMDFLSTD